MTHFTNTPTGPQGAPLQPQPTPKPRPKVRSKAKPQPSHKYSAFECNPRDPYNYLNPNSKDPYADRQAYREAIDGLLTRPDVQRMMKELGY